MNEYMDTKKNRISVVCITLGVYFVLLPFDFISIRSLGSITKIAAILPIAFSVLRIGTGLKLKNEPIVKWLLIFTVLAAASWLTSIDQSATWGSIKTLLLNVGMIVIVGACQNYDERERRFLTAAMVIGSWLSVLIVLLFGSSDYGRTTIVFGEEHQDQNYLCGFMLFAFVFHFGSFLKSYRIIHLVPAFLIILAVILTGSRGALLAFAAVVIACMVLFGRIRRHRLRTLTLSILGIAVITFIIYRYVMPRLDTMLSERFTIEYLREKGTIGRYEIWQYLLDKFVKAGPFRQIFGFGYGTTKLVNDMEGSMGEKVAHNLYIDNLITLGILGAVSTIGLHISCLRTGKRKDAPLLTCVMIGFITMCMSMSLVSYKPMWAVMMLLLIAQNENEMGGERYEKLEGKAFIADQLDNEYR